MFEELPQPLHDLGLQGHGTVVVHVVVSRVGKFGDAHPGVRFIRRRQHADIGFEGVLRPDHVPTMEGDSNADPAYSSIGRLFAIGYIKGLREAVYGKAAVE